MHVRVDQAREDVETAGIYDAHPLRWQLTRTRQSADLPLGYSYIRRLGRTCRRRVNYLSATYNQIITRHTHFPQSRPVKMLSASKTTVTSAPSRSPSELSF